MFHVEHFSYLEAPLMKFLSSYFYQVRNMSPYMIPISTAAYPPKWWTHNGKPYLDKNRVLNGLTLSLFVPGRSCANLCQGRNLCSDNPSNCQFLRNYTDQLDQITPLQFYNTFLLLEEALKPRLSYREETHFIILFHEKPDNPCSERQVVRKWFQSKLHTDLEEFKPKR